MPTEILSSAKTFRQRRTNRGLEKAGTGDVLAGMCAGSLSQGHSLWQSAKKATSIGNSIADLLTKKKKDSCISQAIWRRNSKEYANDARPLLDFAICVFYNSFLQLVVPSLSDAEVKELSAGFAPRSIWLSRTHVVAGESVNIFTVLYNSSDNSISGKLFSQLTARQSAQRTSRSERARRKLCLCRGLPKSEVIQFLRESKKP